jgi:glycosyltransferase involved in cell wall biosynthesis
MKRKILIITQAPSGGVGRHISNLIDGLINQMDFYVLYNPEFADASFSSWLAKNSNVKSIATSTLIREINPIMDFKSIKYIYKKIREINPDVVHAHSSKAGAVGRIAAKMAGVKNIVYTPHAYAFLSKEFSKNKSRVFVWIEKILSHFFTKKTINVSSSEKKAALSKKIDEDDKFIVIPNAIPSKKFYDIKLQRERLGVNDPSTFIVGNIARVAEQKNPTLFIKVAKIVKRKDPSIMFFWVGYKEKRLTGYNTEEESVNFTGEMMHADDLVAAFNLYFCTSIFEGMSYSLLEAADAGVPVLLTNVEGNDDFSNIYTQSELFELSDSPEEIAQKIIFHKNNAKNQHTGQITYSYKRMISEIEKVYMN